MFPDKPMKDCCNEMQKYYVICKDIRKCFLFVQVGDKDLGKQHGVICIDQSDTSGSLSSPLHQTLTYSFTPIKHGGKLVIVQNVVCESSCEDLPKYLLVQTFLEYSNSCTKFWKI